MPTVERLALRAAAFATRTYNASMPLLFLPLTRWFRDFLVWGFYRHYLRRFLRKHFQMVGVARDSLPSIPADAPLIVYLNHPGWWDPLVALLLRAELFPDRTFHAPIHSDAVAGYPLLEDLGLFGVQQGSVAGARRFLSVSRQLLIRPSASLWLTPEGRFADPRDPAPFEPGLAHLVGSLAREHTVSTGVGGDETGRALAPTILPLALEYTFWTERKPEALLRFGRPRPCSEFQGLSKDAIQSELESDLRSTQRALATDVLARDRLRFRPLVSGQAGVGFFYDLWRRCRALFGGRAFDPSHAGLTAE